MSSAIDQMEESVTDFYVLLGLMRTATPEQIRAAYVRRMKVLHPDRHAPCSDGAPTAADLNLAYWTLRDPERRAAYDRKLAPPLLKPRRRSSTRRSTQVVRSPRRPVVKKPYYPRRSSYSPRTRAVAGIALVLLSAAAGAGTMALWRPDRGQAAWVRSAGTTALTARQDERRVLDDSLASSAAGEFRLLLQRSGFSGASLYGQQCFDELAVQPSVEMVDYCLAFDRAGAEWEQALIDDGDRRRYFDAPGRLGRYQHLADRLVEGPVRQAIVAEAAYLRTR